MELFPLLLATWVVTTVLLLAATPTLLRSLRAGLARRRGDTRRAAVPQQRGTGLPQQRDGLGRPPQGYRERGLTFGVPAGRETDLRG